MRRSLILKVLLPTIAVVLALSFASTAVLGRLFTGIHEQDAARRATRFTGVVQEALRTGTKHGHLDVVPLLKRLCGAADKSAFVTTPDGRVTLACDDRLRGTSANYRVASAQTVFYGGRHWARRVRAVVTEPSCARCHADKGPLGYVGVDIPIEEAEEEVREQQRLNLAVGGILAAVLSLLLVGVHLLLVHRPIKRLESAVGRIRKGDLAVRLPRSQPDELGRLGQSLNDMAASLQSATTELDRKHRAELAQSEKLAALGQLLTSVAHEIKNQLAGIIGALKVVEREAAAEDPNKPILGKILAQMERMSQTAVSALDFARPLKPAVTSVEVTELLDHALFFIERKAAEQKIELRKRYATGLPRARVDEELMKQVFLNVLLNGVQAMPRGGALEIEVKSATPQVVEVVISDQGLGILPENKERIFSPFFSTKAHGTGLGLYVARQIVETQRGEIQVESRPGQGTSFTIRLPTDGGSEEEGVHAAS
ncbi:MAG: HAMP domain-containing protein [Deltaproteobacteria bacterium]|nr:HAMP domain-containing protein [Deltaproteobacteria bacterium]